MNRRMEGIVSIWTWSVDIVPQVAVGSVPIFVIILSNIIPRQLSSLNSFCPKHKLQIKISGIMMAFIFVGGF